MKAQAFATLYRDAGPQWTGRIVDYQRRHAGLSRRKKFAAFDEWIFGQTPDDTRLEDLSARLRAIVLDKVLAVDFVPGARQMLDRTAGQSRLFGVSGTPQDELRQIVRQRGLAPYFESVQGSPATKQEAFAAIVDAGGFARGRVLAIGDSITECVAARQLGLAFLGIRGGPSPTDFPVGVPTLPDLSDAADLLGY